MGKTYDEIASEALKLPVPERERLFQDLAESLTGTAEMAPEIEAAWMAEIERRLDEIKRGEAKMLDGEEVLQRLRDRFGT